MSKAMTRTVRVGRCVALPVTRHEPSTSLTVSKPYNPNPESDRAQHELTNPEAAKPCGSTTPSALSPKQL